MVNIVRLVIDISRAAFFSPDRLSNYVHRIYT